MTDTPLSIESKTDTQLRREVEEHARLLDRSTDWVVNTALRQYLDHQKWIGDEVQQRLDAIDRGELTFISHEEALKRLLND